MTDTHDIERLRADLRYVRQHHEFTRDRIGQPGCPVRRQAAEHVETLDRAIAALSQQADQDPTKIERERIINLSDASGDFVTGEDGFVIWWPARQIGALTAANLRVLADEIDRRNAGWAAELARNLSE